jgi:hypothetical protein
MMPAVWIDGRIVGMADRDNQVLFEFRRVGDTVKVSALDPVSNTEVSIVGPWAAGQHTLKLQALRKLQWVLTRRQAEGRNK